MYIILIDPYTVSCMYKYTSNQLILQIAVGDQLTCKVIRGSKSWRSPEADPKDQLVWANEVPGKV